MKKNKRTAKPKRVAARKRPARIRKTASPAAARGQRQDSTDLRRAIEEGMQDLRIRKP